MLIWKTVKLLILNRSSSKTFQVFSLQPPSVAEVELKLSTTFESLVRYVMGEPPNHTVQREETGSSNWSKPIDAGSLEDCTVMKRFRVTGPPGSARETKRKRILSPDLLQQVTSAVKDQVTNHGPGSIDTVPAWEVDTTDNVVNLTEGETKPDTSAGLPGETTHNKSSISPMDRDPIISTVELIPDLEFDFIMPEKKTSDQEIDAMATGASPMDSGIGNYGDPFLDMDIDDHMSSDTRTSGEADQVFNIAPLFTGELEKLRKKELRKEHRKTQEARHRKKKKEATPTDPESQEGDNSSKDNGKPKAPSPNYFVAIRVSNPQIHRALTTIQKEIISANENLKFAAINIPTLHLTVMAMYLAEEDMEKAKSALDECADQLKPSFTKGPLVLDVEGLGNFRNNVLFARVKAAEQIEQLKRVAAAVEDCYLENGLVSSDDMSSFKPHITIMKLSRARGLKKKGVRKIEEELYSDHIDDVFGQEAVADLLLCAMMKKKQADGFYQIEHAATFAPEGDAKEEKLGSGATPPQGNLTDMSQDNITDHSAPLRKDKNTDDDVKLQQDEDVADITR